MLALFFLTQRRRGAEYAEGFKLPAAEVSELESGDPNWESRHLGGSRRRLALG